MTVQVKLIGRVPASWRVRLIVPLLKLAKVISGIEFELMVRVGDTWHSHTI